MRIQVSLSDSIKSLLFVLYVVPVLTLLVGIKDPDKWADYEVYLNYFNTSRINTIHDIFVNIQDPFFVILNKPFTLVDEGFELFLLVCSAVTLTLKFLALKKSTDNFLILFILYSSYLLCLHEALLNK